MSSKTESMDIGVNPWLGKIEGWDITKCNKTDQAIFSESTGELRFIELERERKGPLQLLTLSLRR
jgi:hypothetical protein